VPLVSKTRQYSADQLKQFRAELLGVTVLLGIVLGILSWMGFGLALRFSWISLAPGTEKIAAHMISALAVLLPAGMVVGLFSVWVLAAGRHFNTLLEGVPALVIAVAVLAASDGSIEPLIRATVAGSLLHMLALAMPLTRSGVLQVPRLSIGAVQWVPFRNGFGIMIAGQALMSSTVFIDQLFAVQVGTGGVATLNYANRILGLILALGGTAVSRATLPVFSRSHPEEDRRLHQTTTNWVRLLFVLGLIAVICGWWLAPWGVKTLFERGQFTSTDTEAVTEVLRYGMVQMPFYFAALVFISYASSQGRYSLVFWSGVNGFVSKVIANLVLVPYLGVKGIAAGTTIVAILNAALFLYFLGRNPKRKV
jgi:peptidoglycan biosynthesis protein MviN/MurJ (putative lipid II flippase)